MYVPSVRDLQPPEATLSVLDQRRPIHCPCCGERTSASLAAAARQGWNEFEEDSTGWHISAICPGCAGGLGSCCQPPVHRCLAPHRYCAAVATPPAPSEPTA